ncbi:hypothetical protein FSARC_10749 [Fusarium sarcochroum]|uniref:NADP-dependent oxidoreductase domain-containing protein n=1 Tax=Fusarium sarcochroum TaxID=1208366 RepID=A0A8H4X290_9HYPO|nr:hypothetical protein FSARC_10749 [Fusarium sarcochroum]
MEHRSRPTTGTSRPGKNVEGSPDFLYQPIHFPISFLHLPEAFPVNPETEEIWVLDVLISEIWKTMENLLKTGKVHSIGVSSFTRRRIETLIETCVDDQEIIAIAKDPGKEPGQVLVSWVIQRGSAVLPKSVTLARIAKNLEVFELSQKNFDRITQLDRHHIYNFPARVGVDIFGEVDQATLRQKVEEWKTEQRKLKQGGANGIR